MGCRTLDNVKFPGKFEEIKEKNVRIVSFPNVVGTIVKNYMLVCTTDNDCINQYDV